MESGTQVFELHRDKLECGLCRYSCTDILSFLAHKLQHSIGHVESVYKCDLCQTFYDSNLRLESHYYNIHKVRLCFTHPERADKIRGKEDGGILQDKEMHEPMEEMPASEHLHEYNNDNSEYESDNQVESTDEQNETESKDMDTKPDSPFTYDYDKHVKECYVEVVKAEPEEEEEPEKSTQPTSAETNKDKFYTDLETPFLLVTESKTMDSQLQFQSWLVCIFCAQKFNNKQLLLRHIFEKHPNMKIEDLKVIDIDGTVRDSGIMIGRPSDAQYTKTLITLGEYNKLFTEEENNEYATINEMANSILKENDEIDDSDLENSEGKETKMKIPALNSKEQEKMMKGPERETGNKIPLGAKKKPVSKKRRPRPPKRNYPVVKNRPTQQALSFAPLKMPPPSSVSDKTPHIKMNPPPTIEVSLPGKTVHLKGNTSGNFTIAYIEEKGKHTINVQTATDEEINSIKFLLVTESSAIISNLYLKIWLVCLHCSHKSSSRSAFVNHMIHYHRSESLFGIPNIELVLEKSGLLDNQPEEIKFTKTLMTIAEFDHFVPVGKAESQDEDGSEDKDREKEIQGTQQENNDDDEEVNNLEDSQDESNNVEGKDENYKQTLEQSSEDKLKYLEVGETETLFSEQYYERQKKKKKKRRLEKQDVSGVYPCSKCPKEFSRLRYLRRHLRTHEEGNKYVCPICDKAFKTPDLLRTHRKNVHNPDKTYKCKSCNFKSSINTAIHIHRQQHPDSSVLCEICGKAYCDKSTLMKHMRVHDTARPYSCNWTGCSWRFKTELRMKAHYQTHISEGKFVCQRCGYAFRRKQHLQRHETAIHGLPPPKPRPYRNQIVNDDLIEIPSEQLEINEAGNLIDPPVGMVTIGFNEQPIIYETSWSGTL